QRARDLGELGRRDQPVLVARQVAEVLRRQRLELAPRLGLVAVLGVVEGLAGAERHRGRRGVLEEEAHSRLEALVQSGTLADEPEALSFGDRERARMLDLGAERE